MPDVKGLVTDPEFQRFPIEERIATLRQIGADPEFIREYAQLEAGSQSEPVATSTTATQPQKPLSVIEMIQAAARDYMTSPLGVTNPSVKPVLEDILEVLPIPRSWTTPESSLEFAPGVAGTAGALIGNVPGAALGAGGGEAFRQLVRRAIGMPAATGLVQHFSGMDPDSPEAAATGIAVEAAGSPIAEGVSAALRPLARFFDRSSLRSLTNLLQPRTQRDVAGALDLAGRMRSEGIARPLSSRQAQVDAARAALDEARAELAAVKAPLLAQGATVPTAPIQNKVVGAVPDVLPTGVVPEIGTAQRNMAMKAVDDVMAVTGGQTEIPLEVALSERARWDDLLRSFYESGRENVPVGVQYVKNAADAYRSLNQAFPELGLANERVSDLIDITRLLEKALKSSQFKGGLGSAAEEGAVIGAAASGRMSIPFMSTMKALIGAGPVASMNASAKALLAKILAGGAESAQTWVRIASPMITPMLDDEAEETDEYSFLNEESPLEADLAAEIQKVVTPTSPVPTLTPKRLTPEDFIRRYQQ